jgi:predicted kinase
MPEARVILITGLPGTGKTTLARAIVERYGITLLAKDVIKEPLLEQFGATTAEQSRNLSDLSFAMLFAMATELDTARAPMLLEGNFRPGEHEAALHLACSSVFASGEGERFCQVLCRVDESERRARLQRRQSDPSRHPGHRDDMLVSAAPAIRGDTFLELPGARLLHDSGDERKIMMLLDDWWNLRTVQVT